MSRVGVYVRIKDEVNIIEFMEHYYSIGVVFILMLDDYSNISPRNIIGNNFSGKYKIIQVDKKIINTFSNRTDYLNNSEVFNSYILPQIKLHMDYCLYVDMDEYLVIKSHKNINSVIDFYQPFDQLKINWIFFGNNNIKRSNDLSKLKPLFTKSTLQVNCHIKSLVNVNKIQQNSGAHIFTTINGVTKNILNQITNETPFEYKLTNYTLKDVNIYIAHYMTQDTVSFIKRRFCRSTSNIDNIVNGLNYIDNKVIIKNDLLNYMNTNISNIIDYVHGDSDDVSIFSDIYRETLYFIKHGIFKEHNCNEINNLDLCEPYIHLFDWTYYLDKYPDLRANGIHSEQQAIDHWKNKGKNEKRESSRFDWVYYLDKYPDLRANGIHSQQQAIDHWNNNGKYEERIFMKNI
jgi:hypothetical protein